MCEGTRPRNALFITAGCSHSQRVDAGERAFHQGNGIEDWQWRLMATTSKTTHSTPMQPEKQLSPTKIRNYTNRKELAWWRDRESHPSCQSAGGGGGAKSSESEVSPPQKVQGKKSQPVGRTVPKALWAWAPNNCKANQYHSPNLESIVWWGGAFTRATNVFCRAFRSGFFQRPFCITES